MKVSVNTIKQFIDFELPPVDELVARINAQLGKVEEIIDLGTKYKDAVIVRVVECEKHPNADKLSVCKIDVGDSPLKSRVKSLESDGYVQVVCGAPNVHANMWAVWLPPESIVPSTFDDAEPFTLGARELRGIMSNGMLAAGDELAINSDHDGIIEITEKDLPEGKTLEAGASFAEMFGLDDTIIDIENKMFTHRPDLFGQLGVAREISAILKGLRTEDEDEGDTRYVNPEWYWQMPQFKNASGLELDVFNDVPEKVPRFMAITMKNVKVEPSPLWLQTTLVRWGGKPINTIVDLTNYVMLLTAQPTHAYDYDKLRGRKLGARMARSGEKAELLNGKTYEFDDTDIVIADGEGPVGLAGIMGGNNSEVSDETTNIVLECANFDMYAVRRSSMKHGLFTDALTRFNKGQSPLQNGRVISKLIQLICELAGGEQASTIYDLPDKSGQLDEVSLCNELPVSTEFINARLGLRLTTIEVGNLLRRANFASYPTEDDENTLLITAPFWRTDIEQPEDIVEEVGRLYGFDKLPRELPMRSTKPVTKNGKQIVKQKIRDSLAKAGANEVLTYSFVHEKTMQKAEQDVDQAFGLSNALSPDLQYYRLSVLPSLLDKVHMNIKAGHDEFVLFEIGKGHNKKYHANDDDGLPSEMEFVDAVYASKKPQDGAAYYYMRTLVTQLAKDLGFTLKLKPITEALDFPVTAPFDQTRSALVETRDGTFIGMVGELQQSVIKNFKLPHYTAAMTLDLEGLQKAYETPRSGYSPLSKFPSVTQDISLKVATDKKYEDVFWVAWNAASSDEDVDIRITPRDVYQAEGDDQKTITLRVQVTSHTQTLTDKDVAKILQKIGDTATEKLGATVV